MIIHMPNLKELLNKHHIKVILPVTWFVSSVVVSIFSLIVLITTFTTGNVISNLKYSVYASKPLVLGTSTSDLEFENGRAETIDKVFEKYNCPMKNLGEKFVEEADKNNIPFWVVPAIAFQESTCGKKTPKKGGVESYNAYGYGVWGDNVTMFDDWEHGIEVMSRYMNNKFYSQGVTDLCEIMGTYTPPSNGSWCAGVDFFKDEIETYKTPR
jgi:hypothetical protein